MNYRDGCGPGGYGFGGRHHRRHSFGPFGFEFGGRGGPGGGGFRFGRMLRDGDLRLIALALIEQEPRHGYDIIKALEERSGGFYSPSPGVVYPTLTFLEEAGYVTASAEGNKKIYAISEAGKAHLDENRETVDAVFEQMEAFARKMERARKWFDWAEGSWEDRPSEKPTSEAMKGLDQARRRLRALIVAATEGSEDDQRKVTEVLQRAADEILGKGPAAN
jgi:DNA-binding PadR family transcriptional regulator